MFTPVMLEEGLYLPDYDSNSIMNLANFILEHFNAEYKYNPLDLSREIPHLDKKKKIILLVIDAMGDINLSRATEAISGFDEELKPYRRKTLTSVFPSTTTAALTSMFTGVPPIEHGILGYTLYLEEFQTLTNMILFSPKAIDKFLPRDSLFRKEGVTPENFIEQDSIFGKLSKKKVSCHMITASQFNGTALTRIHAKGCNHAVSSYAGVTELFVKLRQELNRSRGKTFINAYWGLADSYAHKKGPYSKLYQYELKNLFRLLREIVLEPMTVEEREETLLLITADHGQLETPAESERRLDKVAYENYSIRGPISGEARVSYINVKDADSFEKKFYQDYGKDFLILNRDEAVKKGLFSGGELNMDTRLFNKHLSRIGDYVVIGRENYSLFPMDVSHVRKDESSGMLGKHGSLTKEELLVPLLIYS
ncbi:MAG TPA: alkaline phosphatase family protein [Thermotogota bacterium]|nr:alkaline phosphatase family protein [Thermotogota bacterium]